MYLQENSRENSPGATLGQIRPSQATNSPPNQLPPSARLRPRRWAPCRPTLPRDRAEAPPRSRTAWTESAPAPGLAGPKASPSPPPNCFPAEAGFPHGLKQHPGRPAASSCRILLRLGPEPGHLRPRAFSPSAPPSGLPRPGHLRPRAGPAPRLRVGCQAERPAPLRAPSARSPPGRSRTTHRPRPVAQLLAPSLQNDAQHRPNPWPRPLLRRPDHRDPALHRHQAGLTCPSAADNASLLRPCTRTFGTLQ